MEKNVRKEILKGFMSIQMNSHKSFFCKILLEKSVGLLLDNFSSSKSLFDALQMIRKVPKF